MLAEFILFLIKVVAVLVCLLVFAFLLSPLQHRWFKKLLFYYFPRFLRPLSSSHKPTNLYYHKLTPEERKKFEWRAYYFLSTTDIAFRGFSGLDMINYNSVRYLIASVATQMTMFLPEDCFDAFDKIYIYPDKYFSRLTQRYHNGETNPTAGHIILSYPSFRKGFETAADGINLLMHELAHAVWLENTLLGYDLFDSEALDGYKKAAAIEFDRMQNSEEHFFRHYASTNREEFFAVAVENFFERPARLKEALPDLYRAMVLLLNQDTLKLQS